MKKNIKKLLTILVLIVICFGLFGCEKESEKKEDKATENDVETKVDEGAEAENSELALSCDAILASGYDKDKNYYELVANEQEDYEGTKIQIGSIKNGKWSVKPTGQSKYVCDGGLLVGGENAKDNEDFGYIGNACFYYKNIIFNADKNLYYVGAVDLKDDGTTRNDGDDYVPVVSLDGLLEDDDYDFGSGHNQKPGGECFINNEGKVLLYNSGELAVLDTSTMKKTPIKFFTKFQVKDPQREGMTDEYHTFLVYPYSEGLIGIVDFDLGNNRDGFYDVNGKRVIDLSKYQIKPPKDGVSDATLSFVGGKCAFTIINDQDKEYKITIDKTGKVIDSEEQTEESIE